MGNFSFKDLENNMIPRHARCFDEGELKYYENPGTIEFLENLEKGRMPSLLKE